MRTPQAMYMVCWRLSKLSEAGEMTHEQASSVKAWTTTQGREVGGPAPAHHLDTALCLLLPQLPQPSCEAASSNDDC